MIPASYRKWLSVSVGLHALLLLVLGRVSLPVPPRDAPVSFVPVRFVEPPAPKPATRPRPKAPVAAPKPPAPRPKVAFVTPRPKPPVPQPRPRVTRPAATPRVPRVAAPEPRPRPAAHPSPRRTGASGGHGTGVALGPGGGLHRGSGRTNPAPPAVMRTPGGKGTPAPPGRPGGTGTQGTGDKPAGPDAGGPSGPTTGPVSLGGPVPTYPKLAEDAGDEGSVVVTVRISAGGEVESASVSDSSGHSSLDAAAVRAARSWRFRPALRKGQPVSSTRTIRFHFAGGSVTGG